MVSLVGSPSFPIQTDVSFPAAIFPSTIYSIPNIGILALASIIPYGYYGTLQNQLSMYYQEVSHYNGIETALHLCVRFPLCPSEQLLSASVRFQAAHGHYFTHSRWHHHIHAQDSSA